MNSNQLVKVSSTALDGVSLKQRLLVEHYFTKRKEGDLDLVGAIHQLITEEIGEYYANKFLEDKDIISVRDKLAGPQRVIINKYLMYLLLRFKGITGTSITKTQFLITNEGTNNDWFILIANYVIPFFKQHSVMQVIYPK